MCDYGILATSGASMRTTGTLYHSGKGDLRGAKTIWDSSSDALRELVLEWKTEFVTSSNSTYEGLGIAHACEAL